MIFALTAVLAASRRRLLQGTWAMVAAGAFLGGLGTFQVLTGDFRQQFAGLARVKDAHIWGNVFEPRIAGPLGDPNFFAQILIVLVPIGLALAAESRAAQARVLALIATGLILSGAVLTYSRGGALALGCVLLLTLASRRIRPRQVGLGAAAILLLLVLTPPEFVRLGTIGEILPGGEEVLDPDSSFLERKLYALTAWRMFLDHPLLGVGAGNYTVHFDRYADEVGFASRDYETPGEVHYPHNLYLEIAAETGLVGLEESPGVTAGLRSSGRPHGFDVFAELLADRPTGDVGELVEQADISRLAGEYSFRAGDDWQLSGLGTVERQDFTLTPGKDNDFVDLGGAVRYRGFGSRFSPEIGATFGDRDADDADEDHRQRDLFLKIRSAPVRWAYLSLRYRHRTRDYSIDDPGASNFEREDTRQQWSLTADLQTGEILTWNLYYAYEDAESTRQAREFTTSLFVAGVTIGLTELMD